MVTRFHRYFLIALLVALAPLARAQNVEVLHYFDVTNGAGPSIDLVDSQPGLFLGGTVSGGSSGMGTVFQIGTNGMMVFPVSFNGSNGSRPSGKLVPAGNHYYYGTTQQGGSSNVGTIFKTQGFQIITLWSFAGTNGGRPEGLMLGLDGYFYGTTFLGGSSNRGTIFQFKDQSFAGSATLTELFSFLEASGTHSLMQAADGNFYGTTSSGGISNNGTVFTFSTNGTYSTLVFFTGTNGSHPGFPLIQADNGDFYGTTQDGGAENYGTVFKMDAAGNLTTLASFSNTNGSKVRTLMQASDGVFYGTTYASIQGVPSGTVFRITPAGTLTTLAFFSGLSGEGPSTKLFEKNGYFYGTTVAGGNFPGAGTFYRLAMPVTLRSRVTGNEIILFWPTNQIGFTLQAAADLNSSTNWIDSTNSPAVVGAQFTVTNSLSANAQFYRLKKP